MAQLHAPHEALCPIVPMGDTAIIIQEQWEELPLCERLHDGIPVTHDKIKELLRLRLVTECLVVGHIPSPNLGEVFAWGDYVRATDQSNKKAVEHLQVHRSLVAKALEHANETIVISIGKGLGHGCHLGLPSLDYAADVRKGGTTVAKAARFT